MRKQKNDVSQRLKTAPVVPLLLKLSIPAILAQFVNLLYNIVDRVYIGHMPETGSIALTGVGLCFPVIYLIAAFAALVGQGGAPRAAIAMGKGDHQTAEQLLGNCFTTMIALALVLTAVFQLWGEQLLMLFGASESTIVYAMPYMKIYAAGSVFVMMSVGMNLFITTQGFTVFSMITVLIGAVMNIILDPIFIYGLNLGVSGAALATVLSQAISAVWVVSFFLSKRSKLRLRKAYLLPRLRLMLPVLALGLAPFIMQSTEALVNVAFNASLQKYGGDTAVGAMTVASTVMQMLWLPGQGFGQGAQPIMSYNFGAGKLDRVRKTFVALTTVSVTFMGLCWLAVQCVPQVFIRIFNDSEEMLQMGTWALRLYMGTFFLMGIQSSVQQTFVSTGRAKSAVIVACVRKIVLLIPLIYVLPALLENKVFAVFLAEPISDLLSVITCVVLFCCTLRKTLWEKERNV